MTALQTAAERVARTWARIDGHVCRHWPRLEGFLWNHLYAPAGVFRTTRTGRPTVLVIGLGVGIVLGWIARGCGTGRPPS